MLDRYELNTRSNSSFTAHSLWNFISFGQIFVVYLRPSWGKIIKPLKISNLIVSRPLGCSQQWTETSCSLSPRWKRQLQNSPRALPSILRFFGVLCTSWCGFAFPRQWLRVILSLSVQRFLYSSLPKNQRGQKSLFFFFGRKGRVYFWFFNFFEGIRCTMFLHFDFDDLETCNICPRYEE